MAPTKSTTVGTPDPSVTDPQPTDRIPFHRVPVPSGDADAQSLAAVAHAVMAAFIDLKPIFDAASSAPIPHVRKAPRDVLAAMEAVNQALVLRPAVGYGVNAARLLATTDRVRAALTLLSAMRALATAIARPLREDLHNGWHDVRRVYHTALPAMVTDVKLADALSTVADLFAKMPNLDSAVGKAALMALTSRNASNRAATAAEKAIRARQKADELLQTKFPLPKKPPGGSGSSGTQGGSSTSG